MKIRIKGDSVRLRLTKTEISDLENRGFIEEQTRFGSGVFRYRLERKQDIEDLAANFENNTVTVFIPAEYVTVLFETDKVGYENNLRTDGENRLFLLVEKDFQCLDRTLEDQSDMYINPNKTC
ncbi:DUF7009 family protein [Sinomicrobium sp. M5D2P9]